MGEQNKLQNKALKSGERKVARKLSQLSDWQIGRYKGSLEYILDGDTVLDAGCGCGMGTYILSEKAKKITGIDDSPESIEFANLYWKKDNIEYIHRDVFLEKNIYDIVVANELVEHVKNIEELFVLFGKITAKYLIITTPSISIKPMNKWHWRHYSEEEMIGLYNKNNFEVIKTEFLAHPYYVGIKND